MGKLKHTQMASIAKLIHKWIMANDFLHKQGRSDNHLGPQCLLYPETAEHFLMCNDSDAHDACQKLLYDMLHKLAHLNMSMIILSILEHNVSKILQWYPIKGTPLPYQSMIK